MRSGYFINVITNPAYFDIKYWEWIVANEPNVYLALGCHPSSVSAYDEVAESELERGTYISFKFIKFL